MKHNIIKAKFGQFIFLDNHTVVAEAYDSANIDQEKVQYAINLIEKELTGDYALILDRKASYSIVPIEVYKFFASLKRLKAIAIVSYREPDFLPDDMEQRIYKGRIVKFNSINEAHDWIKRIFDENIN